MPNNTAWPPCDEAHASLQVLPRQRANSKTSLLSNCLSCNVPKVGDGTLVSANVAEFIPSSCAELGELTVRDESEFDLDPMGFRDV